MDSKTLFGCVDLFAGAGGLSEGFRQAGFAVLAANDFDSDSAKTYQASHPDTVFLPGPIQGLSASDFLKGAGLRKGDLDCLVGGPPCQAFSVYNHQRGMHDERSQLFLQYIRIVEGVQPKTILMENVTGITSVASGRAVREIYERLAELGYVVTQAILRAEEFGVPQERRRIFFVGHRFGKREFTFPSPTHGPGLKPFVTVSQAIGDLPPLGIREGKEESEFPGPPKTAYQRMLRKGARKLLNHVAPFLAPINLDRLKYIPQGGSWRDVPFELLPAGMKRARRCDHTKRYGRLAPDGLACTILTKCDLHWGSFIHPEQDRPLTVREAARFQAFPDRVRFLGSRVSQFRQVGNAVPPLLAVALAKQIKAFLRKATKAGMVSPAAV